MRSVLLTSVAVMLSVMSGHAQPDDGAVTHSGEATYYLEADGSGNCMFDPTPDDLFVGAMNNTEYDSSTVCGAWVDITGPEGEVTVRIVDRCPECAVGDIDLSQQAFEQIAPIAWGRVSITWHYVEAQVTGPINYRLKDGANQWWLAVQINNHRNPVSSFEVLHEQNWVTMERQQYNYFVTSNTSGIPGPYTFRVTDMYGNQLVDSGLTLTELTNTPGSTNFPSHTMAVAPQRTPTRAGAFSSPRRVVILSGRSVPDSRKPQGRLFDLHGRPAPTQSTVRSAPAVGIAVGPVSEPR